VSNKLILNILLKLEQHTDNLQNIGQNMDGKTFSFKDLEERCILTVPFFFVFYKFSILT
jgi:hypothetical protein